jgi:hypothetical protein
MLVFITVAAVVIVGLLMTAKDWGPPTGGGRGDLFLCPICGNPFIKHIAGKCPD